MSRLLRSCLAAAALAAGLLPSSAQAAPAPVDLSAPLPMASSPQTSLGHSALHVTYTDTTATAVASAPGIMIPKGGVFRIDVCIQTHIYGGGNVTGCAQKTVDTTKRGMYLVVDGPQYTATMKRPSTAGTWAYAYHQVAVMRKGTDGKFTYFAGNAAGGLAQGAVSVPAVGGSPLPLPPQQGVAYTGVGGMNTGNPDSICMSDPMTGSTPSDVSTKTLGKGAPAYYEVGQPTGEFAGKPPKGVMLLIHGGGWARNGVGALAGERGDAGRWRARGWRTLNVSYRPCERSLNDVLWFYDRARQLWGSNLPYCATGGSAGGHLAIMLAAKRDTLACAITKAGPTNALELPTDPAYDPATGGMDGQGPHWTYNLMTAAFGEEQLKWYSPALFPIKARVLAAFAEHDHLVPSAQGEDLRQRMLERDPNAYVDVDVLEDGTYASFGHAWVSQDAILDYNKREEQLVAPLVGG